MAAVDITIKQYSDKYSYAVLPLNKNIFDRNSGIFRQIQPFCTVSVFSIGILVIKQPSDKCSCTVLSLNIKYYRKSGIFE